MKRRSFRIRILVRVPVPRARGRRKTRSTSCAPAGAKIREITDATAPNGLLSEFARRNSLMGINRFVSRRYDGRRWSSAPGVAENFMKAS